MYHISNNTETDEQLAPRRRELAEFSLKQQKAEQAAKEQAEILSKTEVCINLFTD